MAKGEETTMNNELFVEKYRPKKAEDFINLPPEILNVLNGTELPTHLLFC